MTITRRINRVSFECLEGRRLLAGDTDCLSDAVECGPDTVDKCEVGDAHEIELKARLSGSGRERGEAELEVESDDDGLEIEFEVEVEKAVPDTVHQVVLDGVVVGHITINEHGEGKLRLGNKGEEPNEQPLPPDFPEAGPGSEVTVGAILTGSLGDGQIGEVDDCQDESSQDIRFSATLSGPGSEKGEAEFEMEDDDDQLELEFEVEVEKAVPGSVHDVAVDGITVAQITIGDDGRGRIRMATQQEEAGDLPIPDNFPVGVGAGSVVTVGTILTGTLSMHGDLNEDHAVDSGDVDMLQAAIQIGSVDAVFDLDGNESVDQGDIQYLVEDVIGTVFGDANMDGVFDSSDLVKVFQAGQYEDSALHNSRWETGDWNGDGEFDSGDLVLAFQSGGYQAAASREGRPAAGRS